MEEANLLLLLYQKLVRKRKKQDGKQNKRYDINSCQIKMPGHYGSMKPKGKKKKIKKGGKK